MPAPERERRRPDPASIAKFRQEQAPMSAAAGATADSILAGQESSALLFSSDDSGGILPPVSFSRTDHHTQKAGFIADLKNGRFENLSGWLEPE